MYVYGRIVSDLVSQFICELQYSLDLLQVHIITGWPFTWEGCHYISYKEEFSLVEQGR